MTYHILAAIFFLTVLILAVLLLFLIFRPPIWKKHSRKVKLFYVIWLVLYSIFILCFTGPNDLSIYPPPEKSPYKLPWKINVSRFVAQGNRSFVSHRDFHQYAWDFVMPNGTQILAARKGKVVEIEDSLSGIGFKANYVQIEHDDGTRAVYAHICKNGALVRVGDLVKQGQPVALSGMVGQTLFPHLHFYVMTQDGSSSIPITFSEVPGGIPLAGRFYKSGNRIRRRNR